MEEENFEITLKNEFLMEATELANECEDAFIELERNPDNRDIIDQIFRIAHTFKGGALTVGFDSLGQFSHTFENVLMKIREDKLDPTSEVVDILLEANDTVRQFVNALRSDFNAVVDVEEISNKLVNCLSENPQKTVPTQTNQYSTVKTESPETANNNPLEFFASETEDTKKTSYSRINKNPFASQNVLICDDEEEIVDLLKSIVEDLGVTVYTAPNGAEGLEVFSKNKIHSIITDLKMPKMNGIEFIREVRKVNKDIPTIFCSGFAERSDLAEFINLNTFGFIDKPFENHKILSLVKNSLVLNTLKQGIYDLSQLNFNTYLLMSKILRSIETNDLEAINPLKLKLESKMSEVSSCANHILKINKA